ncbi:MAG: dTDP-4-dehydrorhamnose reductase [Acidimicrobiales bacterium]|jgi:dTDP-4-dehydrorhamnose reductase
MRVLVTGARGQLGTEVVAELERRSAERTKSRGFEVVASDLPELDVTDRDAVMSSIVGHAPALVIHLAAYTAVDACETERDLAWSVNALGTRHVVEAARLVGAHVTYVSTDYVFDGTLDRPYTEWDEPNPLSLYGRSKLAGERELPPDGLVVRTSWLVGRHGSNMVKTVLRLMNSDAPLRFVADQRGSPTVAHDLARMLVSLCLERRSGLFHVTNQGTTSWFGFACAVVEAAGGDSSRVEPIATGDLVPPRAAPRPQNSVLDNAALRLSGMALLPDWRASVGALVAELTG